MRYSVFKAKILARYKPIKKEDGETEVDFDEESTMLGKHAREDLEDNLEDIQKAALQGTFRLFKTVSNYEPLARNVGISEEDYVEHEDKFDNEFDDGLIVNVTEKFVGFDNDKFDEYDMCVSWRLLLKPKS